MSGARGFAAAAALTFAVAVPPAAGQKNPFCEVGDPFLECLENMTVPNSNKRDEDEREGYWRWRPQDAYEYGRATSAADWKDDAPCDSLHTTIQASLVTVTRGGSGGPLGDINPNIWIFWARFKEDPYLDTINGIHHRDGGGVRYASCPVPDAGRGDRKV